MATMDWRDGGLGFEIQLGETVRDAKWLHNDQLWVISCFMRGVCNADVFAVLRLLRRNTHIFTTMRVSSSIA